jgi:hypothetical protein
VHTSSPAAIGRVSVLTPRESLEGDAAALERLIEHLTALYNEAIERDPEKAGEHTRYLFERLTARADEWLLLHQRISALPPVIDLSWRQA